MHDGSVCIYEKSCLSIKTLNMLETCPHLNSKTPAAQGYGYLTLHPSASNDKNKQQPNDLSHLLPPPQNQITSISLLSFIDPPSLDPARPAHMPPPPKPPPSRRRGRARGRAGAAVPPLAAAGVARQEPDDDVQHRDHAVDDGHDDAAYPVDDGHDGAAYRAEGVLDL